MGNYRSGRWRPYEKRMTITNHAQKTTISNTINCEGIFIRQGSYALSPHGRLRVCRSLLSMPDIAQA